MFRFPTLIAPATLGLWLLVCAAEGIGSVYAPGDIIASWGTPHDKYIYRFDPVTGVSTNLLPHTSGAIATDFEFDPAGNLVWVSSNGLRRLDRDTGVVTNVASGFGEPGGFAIAPDGTIYVAVYQNGSVDGSIKKIDPIAGIVTPVSVTGVDFGFGPYDLEFGAGGDLFASDNGTNGAGVWQSIVRIDLSTPVTGAASVVMSTAPSGSTGSASFEFDALNNIVIGDSGGQLAYFDMTTSTRSVISSGGLLQYPMNGLALNSNGDAIFANPGTFLPNLGADSLILIDLPSGTQTQLWGRSDINEAHAVIVVPQTLAVPLPASFLIWSIFSTATLLFRSRSTAMAGC